MPARKPAADPLAQVIDLANLVVSETEVLDVATVRYTEFLVASNERAVPDIRDGLKPVHRRILLGLKDANALSGNRHYKSAKIVGDVLGKYHPHGDTSVYDAAVKMAQDFALRYPLVDISGNGGSIDGDGAAAYRYTEMRAAALGDEMLRDLENRAAGITAWGGNYTNEHDEPHCLPGRFPQLLANGILTGIGTGYSSMWLPHNLREVIDAIVAVIDNPKLDAAALAKYIKGPDFPTGAIAMGVDGFKSALDTGKGSITLRAKMAVEDDPRGASIVITEIPWQKEKAALIEQIIGTTAKDKNGKSPIEGIADVVDESGNDWRTDMHIVVRLKRDANPKIIANLLYKLTGLQTTFSYNQMAYVDGYPTLVSTREAIDQYVAFQFGVLTRRTQWRRAKALDALEVQEAYLLADKHANELVPLARKSANRAELEQKIPSIIKGVTKNQCAVIAGMPLYRFSKIDTDGVKTRIAELKTEIAEYDRLLKTRAAMLELLKDELREIRAKFGDERRTQINTSDNGEIKTIEELIPDEACWLTVASSGLVGRNPASAFRAQKRGGAGVSAAKSDDDPVVQALSARTREKVWFLTDAGNLFGARVVDLDEVARGGRGTNVKRFLSLASDEKVVRVITPPARAEGELVIATAGGKVLRSKLADYVNLNAAGLKAIKLLEGDHIVSAGLAKDGMDLIAVSSDGFAARFDIDQVPVQGRGSQGVVSMNLGAGAQVVSLTPVERNDKRDLALVLSNGRGKKSRLSEYPQKGRAIRGLTTVDLSTASKGRAAVSVVFAAPIADDDQVIFTTSTSKVVVIGGADIKRQGRATAGVITVALSSSTKDPETVTGATVA